MHLLHLREIKKNGVISDCKISIKLSLFILSSPAKVSLFLHVRDSLGQYSWEQPEGKSQTACERVFPLHFSTLVMIPKFAKII